jgi:hypothetical protein
VSKRASTVPLVVATRVGRRTCLAGGVEPKRRATRQVKMIELEKEAAFSTSSSVGLGPAHRSLYWWPQMGAGTTAAVAGTVDGKDDPGPSASAGGQIAQCSLVLRLPTVFRGTPQESPSQIIRAGRALADLAALRASELASPCGRNQSRNRNFFSPDKEIPSPPTQKNATLDLTRISFHKQTNDIPTAKTGETKPFRFLQLPSERRRIHTPPSNEGGTGKPESPKGKRRTRGARRRRTSSAPPPPTAAHPVLLLAERRGAGKP